MVERPPAQGGGLRAVAVGYRSGDTCGCYRVWTSEDGGATFAATAGLRDFPVGFNVSAVVALIPVVPGVASGPSNAAPSWTTSEALIVFSAGAVFRTADGGLTWSRVEGPAGQVPFQFPDEMHVSSATLGPDGRLYPAVTRRGTSFQEWPLRSAGLYVSSAPTAPAASGEVAVGPVVPNPASRRATVALTLAESAAVTVDLHDALGRLVRRGAEATHGAGPSSAEVDVSGLAPGVYVAVVTVRAAGGPSSVSRQFVVAR